MFLISLFLIILIFSFHFKEEVLKNDSVKIFIIDSEVESEFLSSPALKISSDSSHGSKIAAVIRSQSRANIKAFAAENIIGQIDLENYLKALREVKNYAAVHPQEKIVVNISLGFEKAEAQEAIIKEIAKLDNIIIAAAAGNNNSQNISYPAKFEEVIAVAALEKGKKMPASNYGTDIDFAASGILEITQRHYLPALNFSRSYKLTGTSFAAPQLSALIADLLSVNSQLNFEEALTIIRNTSAAIKEPLFSENKLGAGKINRFRALSRANIYYFWLQLSIYCSLITAAFLILYYCWHKYSLSGIFIFIIISITAFLIQPFLLIVYYQFGISKIILFLLGMSIIYFFFLKFSYFYLKKTDNFYVLLKLAPYFNNKLKNRINNKVKNALASRNKNQVEDLENIILSNLGKSSSQNKICFYLKLASNLNEPPIKLIVNKSLNYKIEISKIASNLKTNKKEQQFYLIAELLAVIFDDDYLKKKKAAEIAAEIKNPIILVPIKNILKKHNLFNLSSSSIYFLIDILGSFKAEAADLSFLLKEIINKENNPWLKYHALEAYLKVGINDKDYQKFIKKIKEKEKEPVLLALKS